MYICSGKVGTVLGFETDRDLSVITGCREHFIISHVCGAVIDQRPEFIHDTVEFIEDHDGIAGNIVVHQGQNVQCRGIKV